jgi:hypothetical protein
MTCSNDYIDELLNAGTDRQRLLPFIDQARKLRAECGCAMSGAFFMAALAAGIAIVTFCREQFAAHWLSAIAAFIAALLLSAGIGKALGLGIARIRLALLYSHLRRDFTLGKDI